MDSKRLRLFFKPHLYVAHGATTETIGSQQAPFVDRDRVPRSQIHVRSWLLHLFPDLAIVEMHHHLAVLSVDADHMRGDVPRLFLRRSILHSRIWHGV